MNVSGSSRPHDRRNHVLSSWSKKLDIKTSLSHFDSRVRWLFVVGAFRDSVRLGSFRSASIESESRFEHSYRDFLVRFLISTDAARACRNDVVFEIPHRVREIDIVDVLYRVVMKFLIGPDEPVEELNADLRLERDSTLSASLIESYCIEPLDLFLEKHRKGTLGTEFERAFLIIAVLESQDPAVFPSCRFRESLQSMLSRM